MPSPRAGPSSQLLCSASKLTRRLARLAAPGPHERGTAAHPVAPSTDEAAAVPAFLLPAFFTSAAPPAWRSQTSAFSSPRPSSHPLRPHVRSVHDAAATAASSRQPAQARDARALSRAAASSAKAARSPPVAIKALKDKLNGADDGEALQARIRRSAAERGLFDEALDPFARLRACIGWLATDVVKLTDELAEPAHAEGAGPEHVRGGRDARARPEADIGPATPARMALPDDGLWPTSGDLAKRSSRSMTRRPLELQSSAADRAVAKLLSRFTLTFWRHDSLSLALVHVPASEGSTEDARKRARELWSLHDMQQLELVAESAERHGHRLALLVLGRHCRRWMRAASLAMMHKHHWVSAELDEVRAVLLAFRSVNSRVITAVVDVGHWASVAEHTESMRLFVGEVGGALNDKSLAHECLDLAYFRASLNADAALRAPLEPEEMQLRRDSLRPDELKPHSVAWSTSARMQRKALMHAALFGRDCVARLEKLCRALRRSSVRPDHRFMRQLFDSLARRVHPAMNMLTAQALDSKTQDAIVDSRRWRTVRDQVRTVAREQWQHYCETVAAGEPSTVARTLVALIHLELAIIEPVLHAKRSVPSVRSEVDTHVAHLLGLTSKLSELYCESPSDAMTELRRQARSNYFALRLLLASGHSEAAMREFVSMLRLDLSCFSYEDRPRNGTLEGAHAPGSIHAHRIKSGIHQLQRSAFVAALSHALYRERDRSLLHRVLRLGRAAVSRGTFSAENKFKEQAVGNTRDSPSELAYFWGRTLGVLLPARPLAVGGENPQLPCLPDEVMDELTLSVEAMDVSHAGLSRRTRGDWRVPFHSELLKRERVKAFVYTALTPAPEPEASPEPAPAPVPQWATWLLGNPAPAPSAASELDGQHTSDPTSCSMQPEPVDIVARFQAITKMFATLHANDQVWTWTREALAAHMEQSPRTALDGADLGELLLREVAQAEEAAAESRQRDERLAAPALSAQRAAILDRAGLTPSMPVRELANARLDEREHFLQLAEEAFAEVAGTAFPAAQQLSPDHSGEKARGEPEGSDLARSATHPLSDEEQQDEMPSSVRAGHMRYALEV